MKTQTQTYKTGLDLCMAGIGEDGSDSYFIAILKIMPPLPDRLKVHHKTHI